MLLAVVDSGYRFRLIDVGAYGRQSGGGVFSHSTFGRALASGSLHLPADKALPGTSDALPHVIVGDEAFQSKTYMMRPYPGRNLSSRQRILNYRLSRARRCVENSFGMLAQRFRKFFRPIDTLPSTAEDIVKAACCLHNYLVGNSPTQVTGSSRVGVMENFQNTGSNASMAERE